MHPHRVHFCTPRITIPCSSLRSIDAFVFKGFNVLNQFIEHQSPIKQQHLVFAEIFYKQWTYRVVQIDETSTAEIYIEKFISKSS